MSRHAVLELHGISKSFGAIRALSDVTLSVQSGEVLALVGENGAGKSTLLRILSGAQQPDGGELRLAGSAVTMMDPAAARAAGVRVVNQEPELVPTLTVAENLLLGRLSPTGWVRWSKVRHDAQQRIARAQFTGSLDPDAVVSDLGPAQRQLVEIVKALDAAPSVLALDEPTSSLTEDEVARLKEIVREMAAAGTAVIYVSHRLPEVLELADRVAVLRDGKLVAARPRSEMDEGTMVRLMVGRPIVDLFADRTTPGHDPVLEVDGLTAPGVVRASLTARAGEIVGLAGLVGAGRTELGRAIVGATRATSGTVRVGGRRLSPGSIVAAFDAGVIYTPEDRKLDGFVPERGIDENISLGVLPSLTRGRLVRRAAERELVGAYFDALRIRASSAQQHVATLSGGNQQKVVLARALAARPRALILDEPTRGIDIGAKAEIYRVITELARDGVAVVLISSEIPELLGLAHRIVVMRQGETVGTVDAADATEEGILALAMGLQQDAPRAAQPSNTHTELAL